MQKNRVLNTRAIAEIAIFAAIAFILDFIQEKIWNLTPLFPNGGSIGFAMVPIMIISFRRGIICGGICGLITGLLQMLGGVYAIGGSKWQWYDVFCQILLDYTLTYCAVGILSGIIFHLLSVEKSNKYNISIIILGVIIGGLGKFLCHYLAGVIFWQSFEIFGMSVSASLYSFIYNGLYCIPNIIVCLIIIIIIYWKSPKFFYISYEGEK